MQILVLASEPVDADALRDALGDEVEGARVLVVSPALNESSLAFWVSDSDEAIEDAEETEEETVATLREEGISASGTTGEGEPLVALHDALATFPADRIVIFAGPDDEQGYRDEDLAGEAERRFEIPTTLRTVGG